MEKIKYKRDGSGGSSAGHTSLSVVNILKKLLEAQREVQKNGPNPNLQLILPRSCTRSGGYGAKREDWEDSVPRIYREVMGTDLD